MTASSTGTELAAAQRISGLYTMVQMQRNAASQAAEDGKDAATQATDYVGKRSAQAANGESETARDNSQKVLDGGTDATDAVTAAKAAKDALELLDTEGIDAAHKAELDQAIEDAVEYVDDQIAAAEASETTAEGHVATVEGLDEDDPITPADNALTVAMSVNTALLATIATGTVDANTAAPMGAVLRNDADDIDARNWAEIAGASNIMKVRRLVGSAIAEVDAMSVAGGVAMDLLATGQNLPTDDDDTAAGIQNNDGSMFVASYKGIPGAVFCAGADCGQSVAGALTGSWYFAPTASMELYVSNPAMAGSYMQATMYGRYGYWLTYDDNTGAATAVNTYAGVGSITTGATVTNTEDLNIGPDAEDNDVRATYTGDAVGISVLTDAQGDATASGHFDASVNLTATFGANPTLGGNISDFRGNAVNSTWNVTLNQVGLTESADAIGITDGVASGGGAVGAWTATGYGPTPVNDDDDGTTPLVNQRPEGIVGRFDANFADGMAAGAYATRN